MLVLSAPTAAPDDPKLGEGKGEVTLSGSMTRQAATDCALPNATAHIGNIGRMVEDMEIKMRNLLSSVYFGKTKDVVGELRSLSGLEAKSKEDLLRQELASKLGGKR